MSVKTIYGHDITSLPVGPTCNLMEEMTSSATMGVKPHTIILVAKLAVLKQKYT